MKLFHHVYSKEYEGKRRRKKVINLRDAIQECPNKSLEKVFMDKLKDDNKDDKTFTVEI